MTRKDRYAGDVAWRQWFERCSLMKCDLEWRSLLADEVFSALKRALKVRECQQQYGRDYLLAYFDHYFKLGGSFESHKPLKQMLSAKVQSAKDGLRGVVLGSILSGEVRTMSRNMKMVEDGTLTRWYTDPQSGKKVLKIASSLDAVISTGGDDGGTNEEITLLDINLTDDVDVKCKWTNIQGAVQDPDIDRQWFRKKAKEFLGLQANENMSGRSVALVAMIYARSHGISPTRLIVRQLLGGMSPSGADKKMHQMEDCLRKFCKKNDIRSERIEFMSALLEVATTSLEKAGVLKELEATK